MVLRMPTAGRWRRPRSPSTGRLRSRCMGPAPCPLDRGSRPGPGRWMGGNAMQRSMVLLVLLTSALTAALVACAPVPGLGPLFGPDSGMALFFLAAIGLAAYGITR